MNDKDSQRLRFDDWSMSNPDYGPLCEAMWKARYCLKGLTQHEAYLICEAAEGYQHLTGHPTASTKSIIDQLRKIRNAVKKNRAKEEKCHFLQL